MDSIKNILEWAKAVENTKIVSWEELPDIDLYMDQVITYMDRQLALFQRDEDNKLLTSNMINNYVKDGLMPRPNQKKYSREHLALMLVICMLKQVLSIQNIAELQEASLDKEKLFNQYTKSQTKALKEVCERVLQSEQTPEAMRQLTLELSIEANARRIASENILTMLKEGEKKENKKTAEKKKEN